MTWSAADPSSRLADDRHGDDQAGRMILAERLAASSMVAPVAMPSSTMMIVLPLIVGKGLPPR